MTKTTSPSPDLHEAVRRHLAERHIRYTSGRQSVIAALVKVDGPESAADLHDRMRVPLSSLYRNLTVLDEAGVLERHHDADGLARYELAEWLGGHHHHLICVDCGAVEDVELGDEAEAALDGMARRAAGRSGYRVTGHNLEIEGVCPSCR
jgi:Fur family transcriptional regulator, ferric uptake regulator